MKIGELARKADCTVETVRYYERAGLLPPPARSDSNYRHYGEAALERLAFIRRCRSLDMSLDEIAVLVRAAEQPKADCGGIDTLLETHLGHVTARIRELRALQKQLRSLNAACAGTGTTNDCGILHGLARTAESAPANLDAGHVAGSHLRGSVKQSAASDATTRARKGASGARALHRA